EATKADPVESTSESSQETSESTSSTESSESTKEEESVISEDKEETQREVTLDGSVYGSGAGVPGDPVLFRSARALSAD
ncbi:hypothetical protein, partial [Enterococcus malodoratus]